MASSNALQIANLLFATYDELLDIAKIKGVISCNSYVRRAAPGLKLSKKDYGALCKEEKGRWISEDNLKFRDVANRYGLDASDKKKEILLFLIIDSIDGEAIQAYMELRKKQHFFLDKFKNLDKLNDHQINDLKDFVKEDSELISTVPMGRWNAAQQCAWMCNVDMLDFVLEMNADASLSYISKDERSVEMIIEKETRGPYQEAMQVILQKHKSKKRKSDDHEETPDAKCAKP